MKKHIIFLTALTCFSTLTLFANPNRMIVRFEKGEAAKTINVQLANLENLRTHLLIQDMDGTSWFSEYIWGEQGYAKKLNLVGMPDNDYIILVSNKNGRHVQSFHLGTMDIAFFDEKGSNDKDGGFVNLVSADPQGKGRLISETTIADKQSIGLRLANLQHQPIIIRLIPLGELIAFEQNVTNEIGYSTKLNLKGMAKGFYMVYVQASDATLVQFFNLTDDGVELGGLQRMEHPGTVSKPIKLAGN